MKFTIAAVGANIVTCTLYVHVLLRLPGNSPGREGGWRKELLCHRIRAVVRKNLIGLTAKCGGACCVIVIVLGVEHVAMTMSGVWWLSGNILLAGACFCWHQQFPWDLTPATLMGLLTPGTWHQHLPWTWLLCSRHASAGHYKLTQRAWEQRAWERGIQRAWYLFLQWVSAVMLSTQVFLLRVAGP